MRSRTAMRNRAHVYDVTPDDERFLLTKFPTTTAATSYGRPQLVRGTLRESVPLNVGLLLL